jgi:type I restriction enzyme R subunit
MDKKGLSERNICTKFLTPALKDSGWDLKTQIREEQSSTGGKIAVHGKLVQRGKQIRSDFIPYNRLHIPLAIIEAKNNNHTISTSIQQALDYPNDQYIPFVYSSNGDGFLEHDKTKTGNIKTELSLESFPSPEELWQRYSKWKVIDLNSEQIVAQDYHYDPGRRPRYYQQVAINRTVDTIVKGQNRIHLVMATGNGKTYTVFQIFCKLCKVGIKNAFCFLRTERFLLKTLIQPYDSSGLEKLCAQ